jgi:hypothetical protein
MKFQPALIFLFFCVLARVKKRSVACCGSLAEAGPTFASSFGLSTGRGVHQLPDPVGPSGTMTVYSGYLLLGINVTEVDGKARIGRSHDTSASAASDEWDVGACYTT